MRLSRPRRRAVTICTKNHEGLVVKLGAVWAFDLQDACNIFFKYDDDYDPYSLSLNGHKLQEDVKQTMWFFDVEEVPKAQEVSNAKT